MIVRNGIGVGITEFPYRKKPCLYVYDPETNVCTKVASFNNWKTASWFQNLFVDKFLEGLTEKERLIHETTDND